MAHWSTKAGLTTCSECSKAWGSAEKVACTCSGKKLVKELPKKSKLKDININTVEGVLSDDGRGMQKVLGQCLIDLLKDKKTSPARKGDTAAKIINSLIKLHALDRADERTQELRKLKEELRKTQSLVDDLEDQDEDK